MQGESVGLKGQEDSDQLSTRDMFSSEHMRLVQLRAFPIYYMISKGMDATSTGKQQEQSYLCKLLHATRARLAFCGRPDSHAQ